MYFTKRQTSTILRALHEHHDQKKRYVNGTDDQRLAHLVRRQIAEILVLISKIENAPKIKLSLTELVAAVREHARDLYVDPQFPEAEGQHWATLDEQYEDIELAEIVRRCDTVDQAITAASREVDEIAAYEKTLPVTA